MYKQLKQTVARLNRKRVLLFVLIFLMALLVATIFFFDPKNNFIYPPQSIFILLPAGVLVLLLIEITRIKKINQALKLQKDDYSIILHNIDEGLITTDKSGQILYMNARAEKLTGWSRIEAINKPLHKIYNVVNEETGEPFEHIMNRILKGGKKIEWENNTILLAKNTGQCIISNSGTALLDPQGNISGAVVVFNDITERKKIEVQLKDNEEKYRNLIEQASDAILIYSFDGTIHEFNRSCYTMLGYTKKEYSKLKLTDILVEGIIVNQDNYAAILAGESKTIYRHLVHKDGTLLETEVTVKLQADGKAIAFARDITERKKAEQEIKKSHERFKLIGQATNDVIWEWNLETNELWGNEMHQQLYGLTLADPVPTDDEWKRRLHANDRERIIKSIEETLSSKNNTWDSEYRMHTENRGERNIYGQTYIERNNEGKPVRMIGSMMDITERKKAEGAIKKEKELSDSIINSLPGVFYLLDKNVKFLRWNKNFETITGYNAGEIAAMHPLDFFDEDEKGAITKKIVQVFAEGVVNVEACFYTKGHKKIPYYLTGYKIENEGKVQLIGVGIDITERKNAETKTKAAIERYDILADATSDTIWDWDMVNNKMLYNDGITKMFGYNTSEVENVVDWWNDKLHSDDFQKVTDVLKDIFEKKMERIQLSYRFRCADGSYKHIFDRAFVIFDKDGKPNRMIGAMQDITYQSEEEIRIAKATIDAQEEERSYLSAELHDNINQILAGTLLTLGMVKSKQVDAVQQKEFVETAMLCITDAISETRKLSHNLAPAHFEDNTLIDLFENLLLAINLENQFTIRLDFDELKGTVIPENIQVNLYRVLQEQTKNILKYSEASTIEITLKIIDNAVMLRMFDNGKGFDTRAKKTGIGLSNIKKRAESLNGKFILNSAPGKGCEIIVEIPLGN